MAVSACNEMRKTCLAVCSRCVRGCEGVELRCGELLNLHDTAGRVCSRMQAERWSASQRLIEPFEARG